MLSEYQLINLFNKYLLGTSSESGISLATEDITVNKTATYPATTSLHPSGVSQEIHEGNQ